MSQQLEDLKTAVTSLTSKVDTLIAAQQAGNGDTASLPAITDAVNAEAAKVDAALNVPTVG